MLDDSFADLIWHIIGSGQKTFYSITPQKAARISEHDDYEEGFAAVFDDALKMKS